MAESLEEMRRKIAIACRILAMTDLVKDATGHVSIRIPGTDEMLIRCRGGRELGHLFTGIHHIRRTDFDGKGEDVDESYASPYEVPIHGEIYRARPEVGAVIHAHPTYTLLCGLTGVEFRPIFGAYDPSALRFAIDGVPMFPRSVLVSNKEIAADMINAMGGSEIVVMKGHGITVAAPTVEVAIDKAIRLEQFARLSPPRTQTAQAPRIPRR